MHNIFILIHINSFSVGGWLESRFHFRFASWRPADAKRWGFGSLHVMNDDIVEPNNGFGFHPHRDQEIFSYILSGNLTHEDSEGNKETLHLLVQGYGILKSIKIKIRDVVFYKYGLNQIRNHCLFNMDQNHLH